MTRVAQASRSAFLACLLFLPCLPAAELTGTWIGTIAGRDGRPSQDIAFQFVERGGALTGKQYGDDESGPILDGAVQDNQIHFTVVLREQQGNQVNEVFYQFEASSAGDALEVSRERSSARDAVSGAAVPVRRPDDSDEEDRKRRFHTFRLERLF